MTVRAVSDFTENYPAVQPENKQTGELKGRKYREICLKSATAFALAALYSAQFSAICCAAGAGHLILSPFFTGAAPVALAYFKVSIGSCLGAAVSAFATLVLVRAAYKDVPFGLMSVAIPE